MSHYPDSAEINQRRRRADSQRIILMALFARMDTLGLTAAMATVGALALFAATAVLLLKGAPSGVDVGPNLAALTTFLPGYAVSWGGAVTGALYGALTGAAVGFVLAVLWNFTHLLFIGFAVMRGHWLD